jgi:L-alanine-DL-glutamate epimerase-like enolase superfamily enzyme
MQPAPEIVYIESAQAGHYLIPLPKTLTDATHGEMTHFTVVIVRIRCVTGEQGVGYTYTVGKIGGAAIYAMLKQDLIPWLIGQDPRRIEQLWEQMAWRLHYVGRGGVAAFAMSAVDIALWDLRARRAGEPLWRFLGGHSSRVKVYAGGIDLLFTLDELCEQAQDFLAAGFRAIKMKVGRERMAEDIERVAAMRELLGPDIPLMVDANMRWSVEQAIAASRLMAHYDVTWLEEPTIPDDVAGYRRILHEGSLPIAAGENLHTLYEFQKMIAHGAVSFPEPDVSNIGGITVWMKVAHLAEAFNLPVTSHGVHNLHVHLLSAVPNASYLEAHGFGLEAFVRHPLEIRDGYATAPDRPGHGVDFDWDALEAHVVESMQ